MAEATAPQMDILKLTFLRDLVQAAREPEAESFPLMELAESVINSVLTPDLLQQRLGITLH
ncbi:MAG TPA: hypothetical protein VKU60_16410 [Chloroflexota bacterium]|nr:hypothetical protein [Chloroflexota bacterium]